MEHIVPKLVSSEFLSLDETHCSQIGKLGLFCSQFLSVNGAHCFQIGHLGRFCSEFSFYWSFLPSERSLVLVKQTQFVAVNFILVNTACISASSVPSSWPVTFCHPHFHSDKPRIGKCLPRLFLLPLFSEHLNSLFPLLDGPSFHFL